VVVVVAEAGGRAGAGIVYDVVTDVGFESSILVACASGGSGSLGALRSISGSACGVTATPSAEIVNEQGKFRMLEKPTKSDEIMPTSAIDALDALDRTNL
jgi:hypothetical protein